MADTVYRVVIDYELRGDIDKPAARALGRLGDMERGGHRIGGALDLLGGKLASFGGAVADAFTGAVERVGQLAATVAGVGVVAALGAVTYGAVHLNSELEQTSLSLAAIFNAQGYTRDFGDAMGMAADQVAKMKKDVMTLPGDLGQLGAIMKTIATPAAQAGLSPDAMRQLSGRAMLVGGIQQLAPDLVARELGQLLAGRAGSHNILGSRLGLIGGRAQEFNAESAQQRAADITREFQKYGPAAEAFGKSWFANLTTLKDNIKYTLLAPTTSPLFASVKASVIQINEWFDHNRIEIGIWSEYLGQRIAGAFEWGKHEILEWWPAVETFAESAYGRILGVWREIEPIVVRVSDALRQSLADGTALDHVETILKLYGAVKVAQLASPVIGGALSMGKAAGGLLGGEGLAGGAAAGEGAAATLAAAAPLALALAALAAAAYGAHEALDDTSYAFHTTAFDLWSDSKGKLTEATDTLTLRFRDVSDNVGGLLKPALENAGLAALAAVDLWANAMKFGTEHIELFASALGPVIGPLTALALTPHLHTMNETVPIEHGPYDFGPGAFLKAMNELGDPQKKLAPKPGAGGGGGGTTIHTVQINLSTNDEPSRVARRVVDMIADVGRHPTSSRHAPNWSRART